MHRFRQRPGHPGRRDGRPGRPQRARGRDDRAPRRRQVRRRGLQGLRRPARRRHQRGQRALGVARGRGPPRRRRLPDALRARRARWARSSGIGDAADTGTTHTFLPDPEIFEEPDFDFETLAQRFRETAFLTKGLACASTTGAARAATVEYHFEGGIRDFVLHLNESRDPVQRDVVYLEAEGPEGSLEVAMQWTAAYNEAVYSFANNINTHEGGSHLTGFRTSLTRTLNDYARAKGLLKEKDDNLEGPDTREGLTAIISVKLREPQFEGQTKTKLGNSEITGFVNAAVSQRLAEYLEEHPTEARAICGKAINAAQARQAARKARDLARRKGAMDSDQPPRQARRLLRPRPRLHGDLPGGGRLGRRLGDHGPPVELPGDPAPARQDHQRREGPDRQGPLQHGDPGHHHRDGHRDRRGLRHREGPVPQAHHHDRRRRGRRAHQDADPDVPLPPHARAHRAGLRLHRVPAALQGQAGEPGAVHREGARAGGLAARAQPGRPHAGGRLRPLQRAHPGALPALPARAEGARGLGRQPARHLRRRDDRVPAGARPRGGGARPTSRGWGRRSTRRRATARRSPWRAWTRRRRP